MDEKGKIFAGYFFCGMIFYIYILCHDILHHTTCCLLRMRGIGDVRLIEVMVPFFGVKVITPQNHTD